MQAQLTLALLFRNVVLLGMDGVLIYYVVKRKCIASNVLGIENKKLGKVLSVGLVGVYFYFFMTFTVPSIMDIPYLARNEYCMVDGIADNNCQQTSRESRTREVSITNEEQQRVRIYIAGDCDDISIGDELTVKYLPHTHYGCVVEHTPAK